MTNRTAPLFTLVVTESGTVEAEPGPGFSDDDCDALVAAVAAVQTALS